MPLKKRSSLTYCKKGQTKRQRTFRVLFNICLEKVEAELYIKSEVYYYKGVNFS